MKKQVFDLEILVSQWELRRLIAIYAEKISQTMWSREPMLQREYKSSIERLGELAKRLDDYNAED